MHSNAPPPMPRPSLDIPPPPAPQPAVPSGAVLVPRWIPATSVITLLLAIGGWIFSSGVQSNRITVLERDQERMLNAASKANEQVVLLRAELARLTGALENRK